MNVFTDVVGMLLVERDGFDHKMRPYFIKKMLLREHRLANSSFFVRAYNLRIPLRLLLLHQSANRINQRADALKTIPDFLAIAGIIERN